MDSRTSKIRSQIKSDYKLTLHKACFSEGHIPRFIILDRTRNIHSYIDFYDYPSQNLRGEKLRSNDEIKEKLIKFCQIQYSTLDRPFFLYISNHKDSYLIDVSDLRVAAFNGELDYIKIRDFRIDKNELFQRIKKEL